MSQTEKQIKGCLLIVKYEVRKLRRRQANMENELWVYLESSFEVFLFFFFKWLLDGFAQQMLD